MGSMRRLQRVWEGADWVCVGEARERLGQGVVRDSGGPMFGCGGGSGYDPPVRSTKQELHECV
jgi:hypothetical protein